ncbi:MAG: DnaB-like helicase C-terminal domain-containing protein, partial [Planctomycetota bacterium]
MTECYIPKATADKIAESQPVGSRHAAAIQIAYSLLGNGLPDAAVFATLREKFPPEKTDKELKDVIAWCRTQNPQPCTSTHGSSYRPAAAAPPAPSKPQLPPVEMCEWWTSGARVSVEEMLASSPTPIPENVTEAAILAISTAYRSEDRLNVVCQFMLDGDKARPVGAGKVLRRDDWINWFQGKGVPRTEAGAWFRLNPCNEVGSGKDGAITDADISAFRYVLVESDSLPIPMQLALLKRWKIPVTAVVLSGSKSAHAWVRVDATDAQQYRELATRLLSVLKPFGFDEANKNASRLCRLPGAWREIGATEGGMWQQLIWLNPNTSPLTQEVLKQFEETLQFPAIEERPLRLVAQEAILRYEYMRQNVGKLGVPTGIPALDKVSGGWKHGQTIVIAGQSGAGKSTMALHCIMAALESGKGVALFSLEMGRDEIFDLIMANKSDVNRNRFNTGEFSDYDLERMTVALPEVAKLPLYIEDSSLTSADQIRLRVQQLKNDGKIHLVVVDYIQFVNPGLTKDNREQQIAQISHTLRSLARETDLPFLVLSQLNDEGKLRESRVIAHNANVVMLVEGDSDAETFKIKIVKGRGIPCGEYAMKFDSRYSRLLPPEPVQP